MSEREGPRGGADEPVGSVGEEAAKLFGALSDWARDQPAGHGAHDAVAQGLHDGADHAGADGDCRWCPVCQVIHVVRQTSPEVREHLADAAGSLVQALAGLMAPRTDAGRGPVERIDLDDERDWDGDGGSDGGSDGGGPA